MNISSAAKYKFFASIENLNQTAIFGAMDSIYIYSLEPDINQIDCISKPDYINGNFVPDIQIGVGKSLIRTLSFNFNFIIINRI